MSSPVPPARRRDPVGLLAWLAVLLVLGGLVAWQVGGALGLSTQSVDLPQVATPEPVATPERCRRA